MLIVNWYLLTQLAQGRKCDWISFSTLLYSGSKEPTSQLLRSGDFGLFITLCYILGSPWAVDEHEWLNLDSNPLVRKSFAWEKRLWELHCLVVSEVPEVSLLRQLKHSGSCLRKSSKDFIFRVLSLWLSEHLWSGSRERSSVYLCLVCSGQGSKNWKPTILKPLMNAEREQTNK